MGYVTAGLVLIILIIITTVNSKISMLEAQIKSMRYTLDQVADQVDVPEHPINDKLRHLLKEGEEIKAVKEARQVLGLSLLEAKQHVDALKSCS
ncbi:hypothetical protein EV207_1075 [Scopulibacillus darangshiensis]|uniref:Ribosomal L7/L12-like protein n=1 Tax=Scopulibacillus darangshiensis TaxID=442528 RepID=A0A4R2P7E9_9BACL|nr:hypothetical protein [Scopulibacillus darangshiensis]TCP29911.1 hypothetical protein EV207_1075 [Scopulibacillus darangshiensis]